MNEQILWNGKSLREIKDMNKIISGHLNEIIDCAILFSNIHNQVVWIIIKFFEWCHDDSTY